MRLTLIGRLAGLALVAGTAIGAVAVAREDIVLVLGEGRDASGTARTAERRSLVYRLDPERRLSFVFSRPTGELRIISQPTIDAAQWGEADSWVYGYRVVLKDAEGAQIAAHDVYSRALHPDRLLTVNRPNRFIRNSDEQVALRSDAIITSASEAATVDISPLASDPGVRNIDLRVYERLPFLGRAALAAFRRRSPAEQAEMAGASALPPEMLSDSARAALMTNRWRVLGPEGIPGRDYQVIVVYQAATPQLAAEEEP